MQDKSWAVHSLAPVCHEVCANRDYCRRYIDSRRNSFQYVEVRTGDPACECSTYYELRTEVNHLPKRASSEYRKRPLPTPLRRVKRPMADPHHHSRTFWTLSVACSRLQTKRHLCKLQSSWLIFIVLFLLRDISVEANNLGSLQQRRHHTTL